MFSAFPVTRPLVLIAMILAAAAAALAAACGGGDADDILTMRYSAGFVPQANLPFVAVYVAEDRGFFADEGLEVEIQHAGFTGSHKSLILAG